MRLGVIRGDLPGPIFLSDLEPVSKYNPAIDPRGQERYLGRPRAASIEAVLADGMVGAGAVLNGGSAISFPLTINAGNQTLKLRSASTESFSTYLIPVAAYADLDTLLEAINSVLSGSGFSARVRAGVATVAIESTNRGVTSYAENDTVAHGSTANTPLTLTDGSVRTMPAASAFILACNPVNGTLNVSSTAVNAVGSGTSSNALAKIPEARGTSAAIADVIAPRILETAVALDSFLVGNLSDLMSASFNPDPRRIPALPNGAAIAVVEDDGSTTFAPTLPTVTLANLGAPGAGDLTITGTGLGDAERSETVVKLTGTVNLVVSQAAILAAGGTVSDTSIVIPASLIPGAVVTTTRAQVKVRQRASAVLALT